MASLLPFFYVISPFVEMREKPTVNSEVVSQAYFSERVHVLEDQGDWIKIETCVNNYPGWIKSGQLCTRQDPFLSDYSSVVAKVNRLRVHVYSIEDTIMGPVLTLPYESRLRVIEPLDVTSTSRWLKIALPDDREFYIQRGDITLNPAPISMEEMLALSKQFLGLPYTWGGRSSFGYDCSGFVEMLYRQMGIFIPRDAKDQIKSPLFVETSITTLLPGDLIFFGLDEQKIRHVGMYLGDDQFIHSGVAENKPYICISNLSSPVWNGSGRFKFLAFRTLRH